MKKKTKVQYYTDRELSQIRLQPIYIKINKTSKYPIHLLCIDQNFTIKYTRLFLFLKEYMPLDPIFHIFQFVYHKELTIPMIQNEKFAEDIFKKDKNRGIIQNLYQATIPPHFYLPNRGPSLNTEYEEENESLSNSDDSLREFYFEGQRENFDVITKNEDDKIYLPNEIIKNFSKYVVEQISLIKRRYHYHCNDCSNSINFCDKHFVTRTTRECYFCENVYGSLYCKKHINCDECGFNRRFNECIHNNINHREQRYKLLSEMPCYVDNDLAVTNDDEDVNRSTAHLKSLSKYVMVENVTQNKEILKLTALPENQWPSPLIDDEAMRLVPYKDLQEKYKSLLDIVYVQSNIIEQMNEDMKKMQEKLNFANKMMLNIKDLVKNNCMVR